MRQLFTTILIGFSGLLLAQSENPESIFSKFVVFEAEANKFTQDFQKSTTDLVNVKLDRWNLQLELVDLFSYQFESGRSELPIPTRGYTNAGGRVSLTFAKDFIYGFIEEGEKTYFIEPLWYYDASAAKGSYILYDSDDVIDNGPKTCGFTETMNKGKELNHQHSEKVTGLCYEIEYGICADYLMFDKYGSVANVEAQVVGVTNNVNTNYNDEFDDELSFIITGIYTITTMGGDPWSSSTNPFVLLPSFRDWAIANLDAAPINIAHDVASLWTDRDFDGFTVGLAYRPGVCSGTLKYNILQDYSSNANSLRVLTAHELGHNLSATHDPEPNTYIMSESVSNVNIWSTNSISEIESYYNSQTCLAICAGSTPQVNFNEGSSTVLESGGSGNSGICNEPYIDIVLTMSASLPPAANAVVDISVDPAGTATELEDFELLTTSVTFTPSGSLIQDVTVRIFDDVIEELEETIILNITTSSSDLVIGFVDQHTISIDVCGDIISSTSCPNGGEVTIGNLQFIAPVFFRGSVTDNRTRALYTAVELNAAGIQAGNIEQLSLYVSRKGSTGPFQNSRIGLANVSETTLNGTPFYATEQVFFGSVTTVDAAWNDFPFDSNFFWDGVSSLYVEYCFDNSVAVGQDTVALFSGGISTPYLQFYQANGAAGCSLNSGGLNSYIGLFPYIKFQQVAGTLIESDLNSTAGGEVNAGETATFFSVNGRAICSIKNLGTTNMGCVDVTINTEGTGQLNLPFGSDQYAAKTIQVDADNDAYYELTLYYTNDELATWGGAAANLNIIQSVGPLASTTSSTSNVANVLEQVDNVGSGDGDSYKTTIFGDGYFSLTNAVENRLITELDQADYVVEEFGKGILLKNNLGDQYLLTADAAGVLSAALNNGLNADQDFNNCDLYLPVSGKGLVLNGASATPTLINVDNDGNVVATSIGATPSTKASLETGHAGFSTSGTGIVLKNVDGECWRLVVEGSGNLLALPVSCN